MSKACKTSDVINGITNGDYNEIIDFFMFKKYSDNTILNRFIDLIGKPYPKNNIDAYFKIYDRDGVLLTNARLQIRKIKQGLLCFSDEISRHLSLKQETIKIMIETDKEYVKSAPFLKKERELQAMRGYIDNFQKGMWNRGKSEAFDKGGFAAYFEHRPPRNFKIIKKDYPEIVLKDYIPEDYSLKENLKEELDFMKLDFMELDFF